MPPVRTRKDRDSVAGSTKGPAVKNMNIAAPNTPEHELVQDGPTITAAQKQALIDNLQLEVTERARKLRAQYALHAQGLRSRLEMRINRIPMALRNTTVEDLIEKYGNSLDQPKPQPIPLARPAPSRTTTASSKESVALPAQPARRGVKRDSSEMIGQSDKENVQGDLDLPKKRTKVAPTAAPLTAAGRVASRKIDPSKVLSPKSHNSRTLPQSPFKASPGKSGLARPISPIKPGFVAAATASLASMVGASEKTSKSAASSRNASKQTTSSTSKAPPRGGRTAAMRPPPVPAKVTRGRAASQSSQASDSSAQTTIVRKAPTVKKTVSKATGMTASAAGKRSAVTRKEIPAPSAAGTGGRVLRTRR